VGCSEYNIVSTHAPIPGAPTTTILAHIHRAGDLSQKATELDAMHLVVRLPNVEPPAGKYQYC